MVTRRGRPPRRAVAAARPGQVRRSSPPSAPVRARLCACSPRRGRRPLCHAARGVQAGSRRAPGALQARAIEKQRVLGWGRPSGGGSRRVSIADPHRRATGAARRAGRSATALAPRRSPCGLVRHEGQTSSDAPSTNSIRTIWLQGTATPEDSPPAASDSGPSSARRRASAARSVDSRRAHQPRFHGPSRVRRSAATALTLAAAPETLSRRRPAALRRSHEADIAACSQSRRPGPFPRTGEVCP
jgi:hypothetical protein